MYYDICASPNRCCTVKYILVHLSEFCKQANKRKVAKDKTDFIFPHYLQTSIQKSTHPSDLTYKFDLKQTKAESLVKVDQSG